MTNRVAQIHRQKSLDNSGDVTVDINLRDPITALYFEVRGQNGTSYNQNVMMADDVDEIQVLDGSDVLFSMDGEEFTAYQHYVKGFMPYNIFSEYPSVYQVMGGFIPFGRFLNDPLYALDPTKHDNLQVRVKNSMSIAATAWATGTIKLSLFAHTMLGAPSPQGYIMAKEVKAWTTAASGEERTELPCDYPYIGLLIQGRKAATGIDSVFSRLKVTVDTDRLILMDQDVTDTLRYLSQIFPAFVTRQEIMAADADTVYFVAKTEETPAFYCYNVDDVVFRYTNLGVGEGTLNIDSAGSAQTGDCYVDALVHGYSPFACIYWPFGDRERPEEWLSLDRNARLELVATQGSASAEAKVCTVQARPY